MSEELTVEKLKSLLEPITQSIKSMDANVLTLHGKVEEARRDISDTIKENAVMSERINNLEKNNDEKHKELKSDIDIGFKYSRETKEKHDKRIKALELKDSKFLGAKEIILLIIALIGAIGTIYHILK